MIGEYKIGNMIGQGDSNNAKTFSASKLKGKKKYIVKIISYKKKHSLIKSKALSELEIMKKVKDHEGIIELEDTELIDAPKVERLCIITKAMKMDLSQYLASKKGKLRESVCKKISLQLIKAIEHCHRNMVVHHDIKLENIAIDPKTQKIKLIDFGFSTISNNETEITNQDSNFGTPLYIAPEKFLMKKYDGRKSDVWSCGVLIYKMMTSFFPFGEDSKEIDDVYESACSENFPPLKCSTKLKDLLKKMLHKDPQQRLTTSQVLEHPWFLKK
eukprot:TRINITY_DN11758_c0_g1_i1.p1 TRINITY_DN11758_c0_g1~~TRINITY_DN11758_c0_g1_i1.p1  ORF type:complete len:272 (+),score=74.08 TRINITY_DN11758_c0_g1_i1:91-906(+)